MSELRAVPRHPRYKTDLCRTYHNLGYCQYGARCHFVHDPIEAAGVSPMRGHRLWASHDRLNSALLAMAESAGVVPDPSSSDVLVANLRRLHALRTMQENKGFQDHPCNSGVHLETAADMSTKSPSHSVNLLTLQPKNISIVHCEPFLPKLSSVLSGTDSSITENFVEPFFDSSVDGSVDHSVLSSARSSSPSVSTSPPGESWWKAWTCVTPSASPDSEAPLKQLPLMSPLPLSTDVRDAKVPVLQVAIANPMEVSRNLQMPSISDLCYVK